MNASQEEKKKERKRKRKRERENISDMQSFFYASSFFPPDHKLSAKINDPHWRNNI